jgi:hypothetical protein
MRTVLETGLTPRFCSNPRSMVGLIKVSIGPFGDPPNVNDTSRSAAASPQHGIQRDLSIASINEAFRLIGQGDQRLDGLEKPKQEELDNPEDERIEALDVAKTPAPKLIENSSRSRFSLRGLLGLGALGCIIVTALAWQSGRKQIDPVSSSSVSRNKDDPAPRPAPKSADAAVKQYAGPVEPQVQPTPLNVPIAPISSEMLQQFQSIVRELANMEQAIDQLKNEQSQMLHENADLADQLKATHEIARRNAVLSEDLKAMQAQMVRESGKIADQLKANQDSMATISEQLKQSQEHVARQTVVEQKQRPRTPVSSPQTVINLVRKPVPASTSPQGGLRTQDPPRSPPKQP